MSAVNEWKVLPKNIGFLSLKGRIDNKTDDEINDAFDKILDQNGQSLILDFSEVGYLNSTGIATIMGIVKEVHTNGHKNCIVKLNADSRMMFEAIGLNRWVQYFDSFEDAVKAI